jgi:hypothetical protein
VAQIGQSEIIMAGMGGGGNADLGAELNSVWRGRLKIFDSPDGNSTYLVTN